MIRIIKRISMLLLSSYSEWILKVRLSSLEISSISWQGQAKNTGTSSSIILMIVLLWSPVLLVIVSSLSLELAG